MNYLFVFDNDGDTRKCRTFYKTVISNLQIITQIV